MKITSLLALLGTSCAPVWAQHIPPVPAPNNGIAPPAEGKKSTFRFMLKNVKPSLMAYWLDPANHEIPAEFRQVGMRQLMPSAPPKPIKQEQVFKLPQAVDRIVAVDPQNALLVFGTAQGANELGQTINFLDKPLRQVEVEAQFISIDNNALAQVTAQLKPLPGTNQVWTVQNGFGAMIRTLETTGTNRQAFGEARKAVEQNNEVRVLTAPRVLIANNLTTELKCTANQSIQVKDDDALKMPPGTSLSLEKSHLIRVTPTINNDGTISVLAQTGEQVRLKNFADFGNSENALVLKNGEDGTRAALTFRDGETMAFQISPSVKPGVPAPPQTLMMLLKVTTVRPKEK